MIQLRSTDTIERSSLTHQLQLKLQMILQMQASVQKNTDSGLMTCSADSIEFNNDEQTVILKGSAKVVWGDDNYNAAMIVVDLDTEDVALHGSVSGEVNG